MKNELKQLERTQTAVFSTRIDKQLIARLKQLCKQRKISQKAAVEWGLKRFLEEAGKK